MKKTTIKDVAREAGVSLAIASFALNDVKGRVSLEVRARVLETAQRLGYTPNALAQSLRGKNSGTLALVYNQTFLEERNASTIQFVSSAVQFAKQQGKDILLRLADPGGDPEAFTAEYLKLWASKRVDGIIFQYSLPGETVVERLKEQDVNFVSVHENIPYRNCNSVFLNNRALMEQGVETIRAKGYDTIYYLTLKAPEPTDREKAFRDMAGKHGLKGGVLYYQSKYRGKGEIWELLSGVIPKGDGKIAVACWNDVDAINVIDILHSKNISIPGKVGVMGFDDIPASEHTYPPLTTIRQPFDEMAAAAVEILSDPKPDANGRCIQREIQGCMVERESL